MANNTCIAFSQDGQYFVHCGIDGTFKIWETKTNKLKEECIPNEHLKSPCNVLFWISVNIQTTNATRSLRSKRAKKMIVEETGQQKEIIVMGSVNGMIILYDVAAAAVYGQLENGHSSCITAITWSTNSGLFTAADDHCIIQWNIHENEIKSKWKCGKAKVTALAVTKDGKSVISADRIIKWWDLSTKKIIKTFIGHAGQVNSLNAITVNENNNYLISGANEDTCLSIWALDETKNDDSSVASLAMKDEASFVSAHVNEESQVIVSATTKSGQVHIFKCEPNGSFKPFKPKLKIAVTSYENEKETVQQIPIIMAKLIENEHLLLAYGSFVNPIFEIIIPDYSNKMQYLIRSEVKKTKEKKDESVAKVKVENNVEYLSPGIGNTMIKRHRTSSASSQLPLRDRLESLSLNVDTNTTNRTPSKGTNMTQLLMQGLNNKDRTILNKVLFTANERTIRNTVAKLPVQAITPLIEELSIMLRGKMYSSMIASIWLEVLITTYSTHLLSHPNIDETLSPILGLIDEKLMLLTEVSKLRGRVSLLTEQISKNHDDQDTLNDSLIVYQDVDSSEEGSAIVEDTVESESGEYWEEMSDQEEQEEQEEQEDQNQNDDEDEDEDDSNSIEFKEEDDMSS
ncbi:PREDICTED: WD repeat-containing protein 43-like [Polistes dominula]|uniref:WD repeat-containing protein 43-like n=1 Tax=Polistes dominula TaxID=743375 RepID=A0ABM1IX36_POLDO|nr:PREDICTED: WD repeat-containing protein 43-like [Polistes dominula]